MGRKKAAVLEPEDVVTDGESPPESGESDEKQPTTPRGYPPPPRFSLTPAEFCEYWESIPAEIRTQRILCYGYRLLPVCDVLQTMTEQQILDIQKKKKKKPETNIAKLVDPIPAATWNQFMVENWGAGDYHLRLNDTNPSVKRTICQTMTNGEGALRDWKSFPPDLDLAQVVLEDSRNKQYIRWANVNGIRFPKQAGIEEMKTEDGDEMAGVEVLADSNKKLTEQVISMANDKRSNTPADVGSHAAERAVDVVAQASATAQRMIGEAIQTTQQLQAKTQDPAEHTKTVIEMARAIAPQNNGGDASIVQLMLKQIEIAETRAREEREDRRREVQLADDRRKEEMRIAEDRRREELQMLREDRKREQELHQKQMEVLEKKLESRNNPENNGLLGSIKELGLLREALELFTGNGGEQLPWWQQAVVKLAEDAPERIEKMLYNLALMNASKAGTPVNMQPLPPAVVTAAPVEAETEGEESNMNIEEMKERIIAQKLHHPLIGALRSGANGSDFAASVLVEFGPDAYQLAAQRGKQGLIGMCQKYAPIWTDIMNPRQPLNEVLNTFLDQFLDVEAVKAAFHRLNQRMAQQQQQAPQAPPIVTPMPKPQGPRKFDADGRPVEVISPMPPNSAA